MIELDRLPVAFFTCKCFLGRVQIIHPVHLGVGESILRTLLEDHLGDLVGFARASEGKRFREQMVFAASSIASKVCEREVCLKTASTFANAIETIHLGSLVIDDIQDASHSRRGRPALHKRFGVPLSINAGNWLYFSALEGLAAPSHLAETRRIEALRLIIGAMREAHEGQAIDLGVDMFVSERARAKAVVELASSKKTGALMSAAFGLGFLAASEPSDHRYQAFREFGQEWGIALQMLDDLGSFLKSVNGELPIERCFEDFRNGSPSFVWALADDVLNVPDFERFRSFALYSRDPLGTDFDIWRADFEMLARKSGFFSQGLRKTKVRLEAAVTKLVAKLEVAPEKSLEIDQLTTLCRNLEAAYGNFHQYETRPIKSCAVEDQQEIVG